MGLHKISLIAICLCITVSSINETLNKGIVYLRQGNFVIAANHWTIIADIRFEDLSLAIDTLIQNIDYLRGIISDSPGASEKSPHALDYGSVRKELFFLRSATIHMRKQLTDIKALVTLTRTKRGLIDLGGKTFKFLFGTATSEDVEDLNKRIDQLGESNKKVFHILDAQLTILNSSVLEIRKNRRLINELLHDRKEWQEIGNELKRQFLISAAVRQVGHVFSELQAKLSNLRESIDIISQGKINSFLLPQGKLERTLHAINKHLPTSVSLFVSPVRENIFKFYLGMNVIPVAMPHKLRLFIRVPLISSHSFFDLYRAAPLPVKMEKMRTFVYYQPRKPYFAISRDRQSFFDVDEADMNNCINTFLKICSPRMAVYKLPLITCEYALFTGEIGGITNLCEKRLVRNPKPLFYRADYKGSWIYSVPDSLTLTVVCPSAPSQELKSLDPIKIQNTGLLRLSDSCSGYAQGVVLPPHFTGHTVLPMMQVPSLVIPQIKEILNETEFKLLQNFSQLELGVQDKFMPEEQTDILQGTGITIRDLRDKLNHLKEENFNNLDYSSPFNITNILLTLMGIITCFACAYPVLIRAKKRLRCLSLSRTKSDPKEVFHDIIPATTTEQEPLNDDIIQDHHDVDEPCDSSPIPGLGVNFQ